VKVPSWLLWYSAPRAFSYNSDVVRKQLQDQAVSAVPQAYAYDVSVKNAQLAQLNDLINALTTTRNDTTLSYQQKIDAITSRVPGLSGLFSKSASRPPARRLRWMAARQRANIHRSFAAAIRRISQTARAI